MSKNQEYRCWCCGSRLIDSSRLMNRRVGSFAIMHNLTGQLVCPNQCPSKEQAEQDKKEGLEEING